MESSDALDGRVYHRKVGVRRLPLWLLWMGKKMQEMHISVVKVLQL
jgi:hypothetical protein